MSVNYKAIGSRIKNKRKETGITQENLAEKLNVTVGYVSQIERGITKVSLGTLANISEVLDCDLAYFVSGISPSNKIYMQNEFTEKFNALDTTQKRYILEFMDIMLK